MPGGRELRPLRPDRGFLHLLRFLFVYLLVLLSSYFLIGFVWLAFALSQTGRRKRDLLMLLIPVWSAVVMVQTMWRYTAKNLYWSARADRIPTSLFAPR